MDSNLLLVHHTLLAEPWVQEPPEAQGNLFTREPFNLNSDSCTMRMVVTSLGGGIVEIWCDVLICGPGNLSPRLAFVGG